MGAGRDAQIPARPSPTVRVKLSLNVRSDAMWVSMTSADSADLAETEGDVTRLRLIVQGERTFTGDGASAFTPSAEIGLRHDAGDAETGTGVEVGAGVAYSAGPMSIEGRARMLLAHEAEGYEEWGTSGAIRVTPGAGGRGLTLSIVPEWGHARSASEHLWSAPDAAALESGAEFEPTARLVVDAGYGFGHGADRGVLTPYAGMTLGEASACTLRGGANWELGSDIAIDLEAARSEGAQSRAASEVRLRAAVRF